MTWIVRALFVVALWALPARTSFSVEYTYYDSFPLFINAPTGERQLYETTLEGEMVGNFPIKTDRVEGITRDKAGTLYILCKNMVYVYLLKKD